MKIFFFITLISTLIFTGCIQKNNLSITNNISSELELHKAVTNKDLNEVKRLISDGVLINTQDENGYSALNLAVKLNHYEIVEYLIKKGASLNVIDKNKDSALLISTRNSTNIISKILLCNGAQKNFIDSKGFTSLDYATKNNDLFIIEMLNASDISNMCKKLDISLVYYNENENQICGNILSGKALNIDLILNDESNEKAIQIGKYNSTLINNSYCAKLDKKLDPKLNYTLTAIASNGIDKDIEIVNFDDLKKRNIFKKDEINIIGIYTDLMKEFSSDFTLWDAELLKDGLVFRFKNPELLFTHGSSELNPKYKDILNNFFPRYLNILHKYKNQIALVKIQGHTSSVYSAAINDKERYEFNKKLSTTRANIVLNYILSMDNDLVKQKKDWLNSSLKSYGAAYDDLIYDENGKENESLSRRVEFKIIKK